MNKKERIEMIRQLFTPIKLSYEGFVPVKWRRLFGGNWRRCVYRAVTNNENWLSKI